MIRQRGQSWERGATMVEYALLVALIAVVSLGAIQRLENRSSAKVDEGAGDRGEPSEQLYLPSASGTIVGGGTGTSVGSGAATVEVYDVVGSADNDPGSDWAAVVTIRVKNVATPDLWAGVTVSGTWRYTEGSTAKTQPGTCTTDNTGQCSVSIANLKKSGAKAILSVTFDTIVLSGPSGSGIVHQPPSPDPVSTSGPIAKP